MQVYNKSCPPCGSRIERCKYGYKCRNPFTCKYYHHTTNIRCKYGNACTFGVKCHYWHPKNQRNKWRCKSSKKSQDESLNSYIRESVNGALSEYFEEDNGYVDTRIFLGYDDIGPNILSYIEMRVTDCMMFYIKDFTTIENSNIADDLEPDIMNSIDDRVEAAFKCYLDKINRVGQDDADDDDDDNDDDDDDDDADDNGDDDDDDDADDNGDAEDTYPSGYTESKKFKLVCEADQLELLDSISLTPLSEKYSPPEDVLDLALMLRTLEKGRQM